MDSVVGRKAWGCAVLLTVTFLAFYSLLTATKRLAHRAKEKRAQVAAPLAAQNLQGVAIALAAYGAAHGSHLPPLTSPDALRAALVPRYLHDTAVLTDPRTELTWVPNAALSEKQVLPAIASEAVLSGDAGADGGRLVLLASGVVVLRR